MHSTLTVFRRNPPIAALVHPDAASGGRPALLPAFRISSPGSHPGPTGQRPAAAADRSNAARVGRIAVTDGIAAATASTVFSPSPELMITVSAPGSSSPS